MLWLRMQFIKTIIWPKMWLSSLHCCQFVLICVILSCTKVSEIDQAVKWCPIISLGLGGHNVTLTMMDAHLKNSLSHCVFFFIEAHIYSPSLPLPSSVWWITLTWSLGKSIKKSWKAFFDKTIVRELELTFPKDRCLLWSSPARLAPSEAVFFSAAGAPVVIAI